MRLRRVLLCLPEKPSESALALARAIKVALDAAYHVQFKQNHGDFDGDVTPVEVPVKPLILRVEEPSNDRETELP